MKMKMETMMMIILWCMLSVPESYPVEKVIWGQRLSSDDSILDICYLLTNQVGGENLPCGEFSTFHADGCGESTISPCVE